MEIETVAGPLYEAMLESDVWFVLRRNHSDVVHAGDEEGEEATAAPAQQGVGQEPQDIGVTPWNLGLL